MCYVTILNANTPRRDTLIITVTFDDGSGDPPWEKVSFILASGLRNCLQLDKCQLTSTQSSVAQQKSTEHVWVVVFK